MKCKDLKYNFPDYINGKAESSLYDIISLHLGECESCRKEIESLKETKRRLDGVKTIPPDEIYFINFLPKLNTRIDLLRKPKPASLWLTKFVLPFSAMSIILIAIISFLKIGNDKIINNAFVNKLTDTTDAYYDGWSGEPIQSDLIISRSEDSEEIQQKATEKIHETLIAESDEIVYNSENVSYVIDNLSDEEVSEIMQKMKSKLYIQ